MRMMTNLKKVYVAPFAEVVPVNVENLLHSPVSGVNEGQGKGNKPIDDGPPPEGWLGKEHDFNYEKDYDWGDKW